MTDKLIGLSSLAAGADQLFADIVLKMGSSLHVVIPCRYYESTFSDPEELRRFKVFLSKAIHIETLDYPFPSDDAFLDAGCRIVDESDFLLALWDGKPAKGKGGTADIVKYARSTQKRVEIIWPSGVTR